MRAYKGAVVKQDEIAKNMGLTRGHVQWALKQGMKKCKIVLLAKQSGEYDRAFAISAKIVTTSIEDALKTDDFIGTLTNKLAFHLLDQSRSLPVNSR